jgi:hypothetical protein
MAHDIAVIVGVSDCAQRLHEEIEEEKTSDNNANDIIVSIVD